MPLFISRRELLRLERERSNAVRRAEEAERRLEAERERRDVLNLAVLDHAATKDKNYAISSRLPQKGELEIAEPQEVYLARLKEIYSQEWQFFQDAATASGRPESEALDWLDRHHRGLPMPYEMEGQAM